MSGTAKTWTIVIAVAVVASAIGAGTAWLVQARRVDDLEARLARAERSIEERDQVAELLAEKYNSAVSAAATASAAEPTSTTPAKKPSGTVKERQFAFLKEVSSAKLELVADYAQFLSGKAAADAATKAGAESPPPNDYFIVNQNPRLRTLQVLPAATVRLTMDDEGLSEPQGFNGSLAQLQKQLKADPDQQSYRGFWLTIQDGVVLKIEEQFTP